MRDLETVVIKNGVVEGMKVLMKHGYCPQYDDSNEDIVCNAKLQCHEL